MLGTDKVLQGKSVNRTSKTVFCQKILITVLVKLCYTQKYSAFAIYIGFTEPLCNAAIAPVPDMFF